MSASLRTHRMTQEEFFVWAQQQDLRYEYDGEGPVLMTGGNVNHSLIIRALHIALNARLQGRAFTALGPDAGLGTVGTRVRYPDALVAPGTLPGLAHTVPGAVVVFEVVSPTSGRLDRVTKVREYRAVGSILRYVIVSGDRPDVTVLSRLDGASDWSRQSRGPGASIELPEIGIDLTVDSLFDRVDFG